MLFEDKTQRHKLVQLASVPSPVTLTHPRAFCYRRRERPRGGSRWPGSAHIGLSGLPLSEGKFQRLSELHASRRICERGLRQQRAGDTPGGGSRGPRAGERLAGDRGRNCPPGAGVGKALPRNPHSGHASHPGPSGPSSAFPLSSPRSRVGRLAESHPTDRSAGGWARASPALAPRL